MNCMKKKIPQLNCMKKNPVIELREKKYLIKQHKDNIPLMQIIKKNIDPKNIMNPGKIFDIN